MAGVDPLRQGLHRGPSLAHMPACCSHRCRPGGAMATCTSTRIPAQACSPTPALQAHLEQALQVLSIVHLQRQQGVLQRLQLLQRLRQLPLSFCRVLPHRPAGGRETEGSPDGSTPSLSAERRHASLHVHMLQHSPAGKQRDALGEAAVKPASVTCRAPLHRTVSWGQLGAWQAAPFGGCEVLMRSPTSSPHCF